MKSLFKVKALISLVFVALVVFVVGWSVFGFASGWQAYRGRSNQLQTQPMQQILEKSKP